LLAGRSALSEAKKQELAAVNEPGSRRSALSKAEKLTIVLDMKAKCPFFRFAQGTPPEVADLLTSYNYR
jgi:hypothetical protein